MNQEVKQWVDMAEMIMELQNIFLKPIIPNHMR